jgi:hypothetical protein
MNCQMIMIRKVHENMKPYQAQINLQELMIEGDANCYI